MKTLSIIHEFCVAIWPYHNEYVKTVSTQISTAVMGNRGDKRTPLLVFSFRAKFGLRYLTNLSIFCNKIFWGQR